VTVLCCALIPVAVWVPSLLTLAILAVLLRALVVFATMRTRKFRLSSADTRSRKTRLIHRAVDRRSSCKPGLRPSRFSETELLALPILGNSLGLRT
jgi:hypothetical protein